MKRSNPVRRQIFVLTSEEKKALACVAGAFILGLATMHYRAHHPRPAPPRTAKEAQAAKTRPKPKPPERPSRTPTPDQQDEE